MTTAPLSREATIDTSVSTILDNAIGVYKDLALKDFFDCLVKLMECAEQVPTLIGADKKKVVKSVLTQLVNKINFKTQQEKDVIMFLINSGLVDIVIDSIVKLTKEGCKINLQQVMKTACCGKCTLM